jgi:hypothetical protein
MATAAALSPLYGYYAKTLRPGLSKIFTVILLVGSAAIAYLAGEAGMVLTNETGSEVLKISTILVSLIGVLLGVPVAVDTEIRYSRWVASCAVALVLLSCAILYVNRIIEYRPGEIRVTDERVIMRPGDVVTRTVWKQKTFVVKTKHVPSTYKRMLKTDMRGVASELTYSVALSEHDSLRAIVQEMLDKTPTLARDIPATIGDYIASITGPAVQQLAIEKGTGAVGQWITHPDPRFAPIQIREMRTSVR